MRYTGKWISTSQQQLEYRQVAFPICRDTKVSLFLQIYRVPYMILVHTTTMQDVSGVLLQTAITAV